MNIKKRSVAYAIAATIYYVFDFIYMPWLVGKFEYGVFLPLGISIWIANFLGVYAYDYFNEDVLFIELGKNWMSGRESRLSERLNVPPKSKNVWRVILHLLYLVYTMILLWVTKKITLLAGRFPKTADTFSFMTLSIFPSPIAGFIAFRKRIGENQLKRLVVLAVGSVPCTLVWGGGMSVLWVNLKPWAQIAWTSIKAHCL